MTLCRQNYTEECEAALNKQINMELTASYIYMSMAYHFDRDDVALEGYHKFFKHQSDEEREHAEKLMKYQNKRGGRLVFHDVAKPTQIEWKNAVDALEDALALEKKVNESLLAIHKIASDKDDAHLTDYLEEEFLDEQVQSINQIAKLITNAKRCGTGLGEYQFDKLTMANES